ncbi:hypothetical protein ANN_24681 [Periplaneta americana]|uniref:Uncharacterized protein n=1 Tax=Periplaneta americana TaxID=6978 RepID=A0ABQ8S3P5_PERAM|nr:hypothetical protein ANN_24681 [Periplaneta americana]
MKYNSRKLVNHTFKIKYADRCVGVNVQVLNEVWAGNWNEWRGRSEILKLLVILPRIVMLPYVALMCVFAPKSNAVAFHSLPLNKMINTVASYLIFLTLVFIVSNQDKKHQKRGPPNSGYMLVCSHNTKFS